MYIEFAHFKLNMAICACACENNLGHADFTGLKDAFPKKGDKI